MSVNISNYASLARSTTRISLFFLKIELQRNQFFFKISHAAKNKLFSRYYDCNVDNFSRSSCIGCETSSRNGTVTSVTRRRSEYCKWLADTWRFSSCIGNWEGYLEWTLLKCCLSLKRTVRVLVSHAGWHSRILRYFWFLSIWFSIFSIADCVVWSFMLYQLRRCLVSALLFSPRARAQFLSRAVSASSMVDANYTNPPSLLPYKFSQGPPFLLLPFPFIYPTSLTDCPGGVFRWRGNWAT